MKKAIFSPLALGSEGEPFPTQGALLPHRRRVAGRGRPLFPFRPLPSELPSIPGGPPCRRRWRWSLPVAAPSASPGPAPSARLRRGRGRAGEDAAGPGGGGRPGALGSPRRKRLRGRRGLLRRRAVRGQRPPHSSPRRVWRSGPGRARRRLQRRLLRGPTVGRRLRVHEGGGRGGSGPATHPGAPRGAATPPSAAPSGAALLSRRGVPRLTPAGQLGR